MNQMGTGRAAMRTMTIAAPWGVEAISFEDRPVPAPGPREVLVRIRTIALNYRDLLMIRGNYGRRSGGTEERIVPFSDACGIVEAVGAEVTRFTPGDRVVTQFFQGWLAGPPTAAGLATALGFPLPGVASEWQVFSEEGLCAAPAALSDEQAAALPCAGLTAWQAIAEVAKLAPGDTVVLQGTGGVSIFALQFARAAGCRTIITSSSDDKLDRARDLGANDMINYRNQVRWGKAVRDLTGGQGADLVVEVGGRGTMAESIRAVRIGGTIAVIGIVADASGGDAPELNLTAIVGNAITLKGVSVGSREMFERMAAAIALHGITPVVDRVFSWRDVAGALRRMAAGDHFGKIVMQVD